MKTFLQIKSINESKEGYQALKDLNRLHKLELEIQDIQRTVVELLDKAKKYKIGSKEREKLEERMFKFIEEKKSIQEEIDYEIRIFKRSIALIDTDGHLDVEDFFN